MFMSLNDATDGWAGYLAAALLAWKVFNMGFLLTPLGAILGLGVAVLALYDDFMTWKEGGDSLIDWEKWAPGINAGLNAINSFIDAVVSLAVAIGNLFGAFIKLFSGDFAGFFTGMQKMANGLIDTFKNLWNTVTGIFDAVSKNINVISDIFGGSTPKSAPSPAAQRSITGNNANVSQATNIHINGAQNPHATAQAVAGVQGNVNANMARNMKAGAR